MKNETSKTKMPHAIEPMKATLIEKPFDSDEWIFEIKWDGFRAIAEVNFTEVNLYSRNFISFRERFSTIYQSLTKLNIQAILDGEIVCIDNEGKSDFSLLQNYQRTGKGTIVYYVFDILYYNGKNLEDLPLLERKELLKKIILDNSTIKYSDHVKKDGIRFFDLAKKTHLEGIIAKKANSKYSPGERGKDWLKIKILKQQEAVIAGFTEPRGGRKHIGALVLGVYNGNELVYVGHTGSGFSEDLLNELYLKLKDLVQEKSPFKNIPKTNMPVKWLKPQLVCEVKFQEWTKDGIMRMPIFLGLREDKKAKEVKHEIEIPIENVIKKAVKVHHETPVMALHTVITKKPIPKTDVLKTKQNKTHSLKSSILSRLNPDSNETTITVEGKNLKLTNLKKIFWPEEGYTKQDLIDYYDKISEYILPYLIDRPENLRRNPNGYNQQSFFQKDMPSTIPNWIETIKLYSGSAQKTVNYMICQDKAALIYMANLGCIEINPWLSRKGSIEYPDYVVIDLDPLDVSYDEIIEVALAVKEILDKGKINGFCKTSGSKGMHIYIPLGAKYTYDQSVKFAEFIATSTHNLLPKLTSLERVPDKRRNKVYLDYLQNRAGQTLASPYCLRPKPGATVSTPLEWKEVKKGLHPSQFTIKTIFERLKSKGDVFKGIMNTGIDMEKTLERLP